VTLAGLVLAACIPGAATEPAPVGSDAACAQIDATGKIVVGTSPNYQPFEYYDGRFTLTGFDIAVMQAIAEDMGVAVTFQDYAFDGLNGALQLGEINAAIAAIAITPEREAVVDFSSPYYYGRGSAVAQTASGLAITTTANFAGLRVGVERGSVYDSWAEKNLVLTGIIPEQNLFRYEKAEHAVGDLQKSRLDVVLLDEAAAQDAAAGGELAIVGQGAVVQRFGIAVPQDGFCLQKRINQALVALQSSGRIDELARQYIGGSAGPAPTSTPGAPVATATPAACIDSSTYVMDLTYDDKNGTTPPKVKPGESFTKGWRIRNSGTCPWTSQYRLNYVGGNNKAAQMDGQPAYVSGTVAPGQTYDFYVKLSAPSGVTGVEQGRWQMQNPSKVFFGQTVWVMVDVVAPTATPKPTAKASATSPAEATSPPQSTTPPQPTAAPTQPPPTPTQLPDPLEGSTFEIYAIQGQSTIPGTQPSLSFGNGGRLNGSDGCNTFQGSYTVQPSSQSQGALMITMGPGTSIACEADVADQAQSFLSTLGQVTAYSYPPQGLLLALLNPSGSDVLSGERQ
jgi:polar amino acid transport system substrate-binding protein